MQVLLARILQILKQVWGPIAAWVASRGIEVGAAVAIRAAVLIAWGIFLAALNTGMAGMALISSFNSNPFSSVSHDVMVLVCATFPVHFALGLFAAYIEVKFSLWIAGLAMNATIKGLFGG